MWKCVHVYIYVCIHVDVESVKRQFDEEITDAEPYSRHLQALKLKSRLIPNRIGSWTNPIDTNTLKPNPEGPIVIPKKLETGFRPDSAGIPYTFLLRIEAIGFPTFRLLRPLQLWTAGCVPRSKHPEACSLLGWVSQVKWHGSAERSGLFGVSGWRCF